MSYFDILLFLYNGFGRPLLTGGPGINNTPVPSSVFSLPVILIIHLFHFSFQHFTGQHGWI